MDDASLRLIVDMSETISKRLRMLAKDLERREMMLRALRVLDASNGAHGADCLYFRAHYGGVGLRPEGFDGYLKGLADPILDELAPALRKRLISKAVAQVEETKNRLREAIREFAEDHPVQKILNEIGEVADADQELHD